MSCNKKSILYECGKKRWMSCVKDDMSKRGVSAEMTAGRSLLREVVVATSHEWEKD